MIVDVLLGQYGTLFKSLSILYDNNPCQYTYETYKTVVGICLGFCPHVLGMILPDETLNVKLEINSWF